MADFPMGTLVGKEDSSQRKEGHAGDPAMANETDGGYTITRPRYTRRPRRLYEIGFTDISTAEKDLIRDFYETKLGGSMSFTWLNPVNEQTITVRFKKDSMPQYSYTGKGPTQRWNVTGIVLVEV